MYLFFEMTDAVIYLAHKQNISWAMIRIWLFTFERIQYWGLSYAMFVIASINPKIQFNPQRGIVI